MNSTALDQSTDTAPASNAPPLKIPWWTRGDLNAFFGLAFNILVNVLTLTSLLIFVVHVPTGSVISTVLPALANTRKSLEIDWRAGVPVATSGRNGVGRSSG